MAIKRDEVLPGGVPIPGAYWFMNDYSVDYMNGRVTASFIAWRDSKVRQSFKDHREVFDAASKAEEIAKRQFAEAEDRKDKKAASREINLAEDTKQDALEGMNAEGPMRLTRSTQIMLSDFADAMGNFNRADLYAAVMGHVDWSGSVEA